MSMHCSFDLGRKPARDCVYMHRSEDQRLCLYLSIFKFVGLQRFLHHYKKLSFEKYLCGMIKKVKTRLYKI